MALLQPCTWYTTYDCGPAAAVYPVHYIRPWPCCNVPGTHSCVGCSSLLPNFLSQCLQHSQLSAFRLTSTLRHNAVNILGITRAGDRRPSRPPAKLPCTSTWYRKQYRGVLAAPSARRDVRRRFVLLVDLGPVNSQP